MIALSALRFSIIFANKPYLDINYTYPCEISYQMDIHVIWEKLTTGMYSLNFLLCEIIFKKKHFLDKFLILNIYKVVFFGRFYTQI